MSASTQNTTACGRDASQPSSANGSSVKTAKAPAPTGMLPKDDPSIRLFAVGRSSASANSGVAASRADRKMTLAASRTNAQR